MEIINGFFETDQFIDFTSDNPGLTGRNLILDSLKIFVVKDADSLDRLLAYIPLDIVGDTSFVIVTALKDSFDLSKFDNFTIIYQKNTNTAYNNNNVPYGTTYMEPYGHNPVSVELTTDANLDIISSSMDSTFTVLYCDVNSRLAGPVWPSLACIATSLDNLYTSCSNSNACTVLRAIANAIGGVWAAADLATAVGWCTGHYNNPWVGL